VGGINTVSGIWQWMGFVRRDQYHPDTIYWKKKEIKELKQKLWCT
jgi:hypothetical protein